MRSILFATALIVGCLLTTIDAMGQNVCLPPGPGARTSVPRPDRLLLAPLSEYDCAFKASRLEDSGGEPAKLDYERQCHRHAEMILRQRLLQLQASVNATIKAVERRAQPAIMCRAAGSGAAKPEAGTSIPLPDRALLAPPAELSCEFKPSSGLSAEAALQMKLDYEQQCWRHAEMIARNSLRRLQASVGETIKAVDRNEQRVVKPGAAGATAATAATSAAQRPGTGSGASVGRIRHRAPLYGNDHC